MAQHSTRLKQILMACLLAAWPLLATAQTPPPSTASTEHLTVSRTAPPSADDPLALWFKEQDRLLDDILLRLARIELLVREIHRLVSQLPAATAVAHSTPAPTEEKAFDIASWLPLAGVGGLLILLLLWRKKRRPAKPPSAATPTSADKMAAVPPAPAVKRAPPALVAASAAHAFTAHDEQADQALELAEIMLSMGLGHGAAQTLAEQIRNEPKQALRQWLKLLEIYRRNGQRDEFEQSAEALRQHFNVQPEDWHAAPEAHASLEDYPHIAAQLTKTWRKVGCLTYMQELLNDNRGGARAGFPQAVAEELLLLAAMLKSGG